jgi:glycosyltransferase involved in cell wall biosynthesis
VKITFVIPTADLGGGTRVIAIHAQRLQQRGHDVTIVSTPAPKPTLRDKVRSIVRRTEWPGSRPSSPTHLDNLGVRHHVIDRERPIERRDVPDADVIIATWWETAEWVAAMPPSTGAKVYFLQGYEIWGGPPARVEATWRLPMHKIVISRHLMDLAVNTYGDPRASHVPNSVDTVQFRAPPRGKQPTPTVGLLYSMRWFKGCDLSLKVFDDVARQIPGLKLQAFGKEHPSSTLPLPASATYTCTPPQDQIRDIYARCDVWLCGSRTEGFHLPPLEAMACRCPVVSTAVGGPMDVIENGINGYVVPIDDAKALTEKLVNVLTLSDRSWRTMSDAAHATATRYTWDDASERFEAALVQAVARRGSLQTAGAP